MKNLYKISSLVFIMFCTTLLYGQGQPLVFPRASPANTLSTVIGVTNIEMHYSSPSVQGRILWGEIVPYDQVWRAGANENTTISFDTPVTIGGKSITAGTYGLIRYRPNRIGP